MMTGCVELIYLLTAYLTFLLISETPTIQAQEAEGSIRLRRGINSQSGYLEVFHDGGWGRVCDTQWDHSDAHVVCKQEGYNGAKFPPDPFQQTPNTARPIILDNVQCAGRETALTQCEKGPWGSSVDGCQTVKIQCLSYLQQYIGCFTDDHERILPSYSANCNSGQIDGRCNGCDNTNNACDSRAMTIEICVEICCTNNNYVYAGLQAGDECFCGDITADYARYSKLSEVSCNAQCSGNPEQSCGSDFIMDVYDCSSGCGIPEGVMGRTNLITEPQVQQATLYKTGEELSFSCQAGFRLLGAEKISCQPGGPWSAIVPECVDKTVDVPVMNPCSAPDVPQNGQYIPVLLTYQSGSNVQLICNSGFELEGNATRTCQRDGTWTTAAHLCKGVAKCPSPTTPSNGQMAPVKVNYDPGESVSFTCSVGYLVQGASTVICKDDNTWSDFIPTCQTVDCGPLPNYPRTTPSTAETAYQTSVTFACIDRYQFVNGQTSPSKICERDGSWVGADPVCELRECMPLPEYNDTVRSTEETAVGTLVSFNCKPGYQLTETVHIPSKECTQDDVWIGENPVCIFLACGKVPSFPNAIPHFEGDLHGVLTTVGYNCSERYEHKGDKKPYKTCNVSLKWDGSDPNCQAVRCASSEVPAGWTSKETVFPVDKAVNFNCTKNQTSGKGYMYCKADGSWNTDTPNCDVTGKSSDLLGIPVAVWIILLIIVVLLILLCVACIVYKVHTGDYANYKKNEAKNSQGNVPMQNIMISSPKPIGETNYGMTNDEADTGVASNSSDNQDFSMSSEANYPYHGHPYADSEYQAGANDSGMYPSDVDSDGARVAGGPDEEDEEEEEEEAGPSGEQTKSNEDGNKKGDGDKKDKAFVDDMLDSAKEKLDNCVIQ